MTTSAAALTINIWRVNAHSLDQIIASVLDDLVSWAVSCLGRQLVELLNVLNIVPDVRVLVALPCLFALIGEETCA